MQYPNSLQNDPIKFLFFYRHQATPEIPAPVFRQVSGRQDRSDHADPSAPVWRQRVHHHPISNSSIEATVSPATSNCNNSSKAATSYRTSAANSMVQPLRLQACSVDYSVIILLLLKHQLKRYEFSNKRSGLKSVSKCIYVCWPYLSKYSS